MLTLKLEMWPHGVMDRAHEIGRVYIHNVSNLAPMSNYRGVVCRRGVYEPAAVAMRRATRKIEVNNYPRERLNVWCLVTRALLSAFPEERPKNVDPPGLVRIAEALGLPDGATEADVLGAIAVLRTGD